MAAGQRAPMEASVIIDIYCLSKSLKVIGADTDRSGTCDFLLTFHSNHEPILYRFS